MRSLVVFYYQKEYKHIADAVVHRHSHGILTILFVVDIYDSCIKTGVFLRENRRLVSESLGEFLLFVRYCILREAL